MDELPLALQAALGLLAAGWAGFWSYVLFAILADRVLRRIRRRR